MPNYGYPKVSVEQMRKAYYPETDVFGEAISKFTGAYAGRKVEERKAARELEKLMLAGQLDAVQRGVVEPVMEKPVEIGAGIPFTTEQVQQRVAQGMPALEAPQPAYEEFYKGMPVQLRPTGIEKMKLGIKEKAITARANTATLRASQSVEKYKDMSEQRAFLKGWSENYISKQTELLIAGITEEDNLRNAETAGIAAVEAQGKAIRPTRTIPPTKALTSPYTNVSDSDYAKSISLYGKKEAEKRWISKGAKRK